MAPSASASRSSSDADLLSSKIIGTVPPSLGLMIMSVRPFPDSHSVFMSYLLVSECMTVMRMSS